MRIFKGQSSIRLTLKTYCNLQGFTSAGIRYQKPNGKTGGFNAFVSDTEKGLISYECLEGDIDSSGWWAFWAFVTFDDGRTALGQAAKVFIWNEGAG